MTDASKLECPRCGEKHIDILAHSRPSGVWQIYRCSQCFFAWRSSEPDYITKPDQYDEHFKLTPEEIHQSPVVPDIPEKLN